MRLRVVIFLTLSISAVLSHPALSDESNEDQFHFEALACRNSNALLATAQDLPDKILPLSVKDEGNENDPETNLGMVVQEYSISQTEVTARQYCTYLNQVATGENFERFYNEKMGTDPNVASIRRDVVDGKNVYTVIVDKKGDRSHFPIVYVNLYQAARFCNWLQNQSTPGLAGDDLTERGAYTLDGKSSGCIVRNAGAVWFIPKTKVNGTNQPTTKVEGCARGIGNLQIEAIGLLQIYSRMERIAPTTIRRVILNRGLPI